MVEVRDFDVVIVGSGAGGGTVAHELAGLAAEGLRVAVLESGPRLRESEYTGRELEMADRLYFDQGGFLTRDRNMTLAFGHGYGGSTVVYTGTSIPIARETVERWGVPGLAFEDLSDRSRKFLVENAAHRLEPALLNDNNRLFREGCESLGWAVEQFPVNVKGCHGSGLCNLGCPNGAKQGTHRVQLPDAERRGVVVVTNCHVDRIERNICHATVSERAVGLPSAWAPGSYTVRARVVVVAAGAVNSPALLLRSRLPELPALGRYFTCHPALILVGQHDRAITNYEGHPKSYCCSQFAERERFLLETCMYFPFTTARSLAGFGPEHEELMSRMDTLQMILALALDEARPENRVTVDRSGNPVVDYRLSPEVLGSLLASMKAAARIFFAAGAKRVHCPASRSFFIEPADVARLDDVIRKDELVPGKTTITSAHLMGGCRMGADPRTSVTTAWGEVHGAPWLFVADASLFPSCARINPYVTVMALADRVAEKVRSRVRELAPPAPVSS
jgi:choline dehydrogenase-like flavoprotein